MWAYLTHEGSKAQVIGIERDFDQLGVLVPPVIPLPRQRTRRVAEPVPETAGTNVSGLMAALRSGSL